MIELTKHGTAESVRLDHLHWQAEFGTPPVGQQRWRTVAGVHVIQETAMQYGMPLVLASVDGRVWLPRSDVEMLYSWITVGTIIRLVLHDAREFFLRWDVPAGAIETATVLPGLANPAAASKYGVRALRFTTAPAPA